MSEDVDSTLQDRLDDIEKDFNNTWVFHTRVIENLHRQMDREQRPSWNPIRLWRRRKSLSKLKNQHAVELGLMLRLGSLWESFYMSVQGPIRENDDVGFRQWCRWYEYRITAINNEYAAAVKEIGK